METENKDPETEPIASETFGEFAQLDASPPAATDREVLEAAAGAIRGRWEIPLEVFSELPVKLAKLALGENNRVAIKAARLLIEMNRANAEQAVSDIFADVQIYIPDNGRGGAQ